MYCVNCGVKLADTEEKCPLCNTAPGEPLNRREPARALYPKNRYPEVTVKPSAVNSTILVLFLIPLLVTFFVDLQTGQKLDWFWYVAGALVLAYVVFALPIWFRKPNFVIFVPCDFAASALYLLLINLLKKWPALYWDGQRRNGLLKSEISLPQWWHCCGTCEKADCTFLAARSLPWAR